MDKFVALMHRYCHDYTNCRNLAVCDKIMVPGYTLHMGTHDIAGRDECYKPAARKQFEQFPGLCLTVNEIVTNGERLVMRFAEHGASLAHGGAPAAWSGIGLYKWDGERLVENFVEQDYYSRREQLAGGAPKPVEAPAMAPWDAVAQAPDPAAEAAVRGFLASGDLAALPGVVFDDEWTGSPRQRVLEPLGAEIDDLFCAGDRVAFRIRQHGRLVEDFAGGNVELVGRGVFLHMTGLVTVRHGEIVAGRVVRDRLGLQRRLRG